MGGFESPIIEFVVLIADLLLVEASQQIENGARGQSAVDEARFISDCQNNTDKGIVRRRRRDPMR